MIVLNVTIEQGYTSGRGGTPSTFSRLYPVGIEATVACDSPEAYASKYGWILLDMSRRPRGNHMWNA
jgi:hypothetical protein